MALAYPILCIICHLGFGATPLKGTEFLNRWIIFLVLKEPDSSAIEVLTLRGILAISSRHSRRNLKRQGGEPRLGLNTG